MSFNKKGVSLKELQKLADEVEAIRQPIVSPLSANYPENASIQDALRNCWVRGKNAESRFETVLTENGYAVTKATDKEDIIDHIDFYIVSEEGTYSVDVKSKRSLKKGERSSEADWVYLEIKNVMGKDGWLFGSADLIAFEREEGFILASRLDILNVAKRLCNLNALSHKASEAKYKAYSRPGRSDLITLIHISDVMSCGHKFIKPKL